MKEERKMLLFIQYPKCSTCKTALKELEKLLTGTNLKLTTRDIVKETPTVKELTLWQSFSEQPLKKWFNTSGQLYRQLNLKERLANLSAAEQLELLAKNGMLIKRPILIETSSQTVILGKDLAAYQALIAKLA